jgi:hypothetical protein
MESSPNNSDNYEKPSRRGQWQEKSERPILTRPMTKAEIEEHRLNLVNSYQCNDSDITIDIQKIFDEKDEDRDDCVWLKYKMRCVMNGKPVIREIFSIKLPVPEEIRRASAEMKKARSKAPVYRKPIRSLPSPTTPVVDGVPNK